MNGLSIAGWLGTAALLGGFGIASLAAIRAPRIRGFWVPVAVLLAILTVYRFLNIEHTITDAFRQWAQARGDYEARRLPQAILVSTVLIAGFVFAVWLIRWNRPPVRKVGLAAIVALIGLSALRTLSLHMTDSVLYASIGPLHLNWVVEAGLLALLSGCAIDEAFRRRVAPRR